MGANDCVSSVVLSAMQSAPHVEYKYRIPTWFRLSYIYDVIDDYDNG